ncbi:restriction endonuclease subunit S [Desulfobacter sp.]|uniref:restriction endonuclease subunit S n=1 Tax=Desulfobacter sp. TaxID=2294 RepID=UPI00257FA168|nr:restriction endonuclease subunit S [Desulfobacter sp.]
MTELLPVMPRYETYKDSGVGWIGKIPAPWEEKRLKFTSRMIVSNVDKIVKEFETPVKLCNYVDVYKNNYITNKIPFMEVSATEEEIIHYKIKINDVLITKDSEDWLDIGVPALVKHEESRLICGYHLTILRAHNQIIGEYLFWTLLAQYNRIQFSLRANGITRYGISHGAIKNIWLILPCIQEQSIIANFLDYKTEKIDQAVAIKEKQIQLLKERKQILIQTAVTKGLDPNVPMADSGVEWIGQIPAHWEKTRLKFVSKIQSGLTLGKQYPPGNLSEYPYLRVANVQNGFFNLNDVATIYLPKNEALKYLLSKHDILVTEGGDIDKLGRGTVWESDIEPCLHQNHIFAIRIVSSRINCNFIAQFMTTEKVRKYFIDTATKTTNLASTNRTTLGNLTLLIPPLNEQNKILSHIHTQSAKIDKAIDIQAQMIEKLKEYKATLINAAVTGKIKVPDPAESKVVA